MKILKDELSFDRLLKEHKYVLADFYADWCAPCKTMNLILKKWEQVAEHQPAIVRVDAEKNVALTIKYQVKGIPTLILFRDGRAVWQRTGLVSAEDLNAIFADYSEPESR